MSYAIALVEKKIKDARYKMSATSEASFACDAIDDLIEAVETLKDIVYELDKKVY